MCMVWVCVHTHPRMYHTLRPVEENYSYITSLSDLKSRPGSTRLLVDRLKPVWCISGRYGTKKLYISFVQCVPLESPGKVEIIN